MRNLIVTVAFSIFLLNCSSGKLRHSDPIPESPSNPATRVAVATSFASDPGAATSISEVRSLTFNAWISGVETASDIAVEFYAPAGTLYEKRTASLGAQPVQHLEFQLPVAGTFIDTAGLSGTWTARVFVGGSFAASQTIELTP